MTATPVFLTEEYPCSYLENEVSQSLIVHPAFKITTAEYTRLIEQGFRRSGNEVYAPHCSKCSACMPARLNVAEFKPNKSQKRCLRKNIKTQAIVKPAVYCENHYEMYLRYQLDRHKDGNMAHLSPNRYIQFLSSFWCETRFVEFRINNKLAAVAIIDQLENAWSAVYTFFEPDLSSYSLGAYAILWEIEQAKSQQKEFLYLGYWIKNCRKMAYKSNYQPLQILIENEWVDMSSQPI